MRDLSMGRICEPMNRVVPEVLSPRLTRPPVTPFLPLPLRHDPQTDSFPQAVQ